MGFLCGDVTVYQRVVITWDSNPMIGDRFQLCPGLDPEEEENTSISRDTGWWYTQWVDLRENLQETIDFSNDFYGIFR